MKNINKRLQKVAENLEKLAEGNKADDIYNIMDKEIKIFKDKIANFRKLVEDYLNSDITPKIRKKYNQDLLQKVIDLHTFL